MVPLKGSPATRQFATQKFVVRGDDVVDERCQPAVSPRLGRRFVRRRFELTECSADFRQIDVLRYAHFQQRAMSAAALVDPITFEDASASRMFAH